MTSLKLYGPRSGSSLRTHWVAAELGVAYESVAVDFAKAEHRSESFLKINPMGQVPALSEGDFNLAESMASCSFLIDQAGSDLGGRTAQERASAWQWSLWAMLNPQPHLATLASPAWTKQPLAATAEAAARDGAAKYLRILQTHLAGRPFVAGSRFTVGDINVASSLAYAAYSNYDLSPYPAITAWLGGIQDRPAYFKATAVVAG